MYFYSCNGKSSSVCNKIVKAKTSKYKAAMGFVSTILYIYKRWVVTKEIFSECAGASVSHQVAESISRNIKLALSYIKASTGISTSEFINTCQQVTIIAGLSVLFQNNI